MPKKEFDPEGDGYDIDSATAAGMGRSKEGPNKGHMGSVSPASREETKKHKLPKGTYKMLKGRKHKTWDKAVEAENRRGSDVVKKGKRYYSVPREAKRTIVGEN